MGHRPYVGHQAENRRTFTEELADPCSIKSHISITGNERMQIVAIWKILMFLNNNHTDQHINFFIEVKKPSKDHRVNEPLN